MNEFSWTLFQRPRIRLPMRPATVFSIRSDSGPHDAAASPGVVQALADLLLAAFVIVVVTPLALFGRAYLGELALARIAIDLKRAMAAKLLRLPLSAHVEGSSGDTLTRALADTDGATSALDLFYQDVLLGVTMLVIGVATLLSTDVETLSAAREWLQQGLGALSAAAWVSAAM